MRIPRSSKTLPGHWNLCTHLRPCSSWKQLKCKVCWPCVPLCLVAQLFFQVTFPSPFPKLWWSTSKRCLKRKYNSVHWLLCENLISLGVKFCLYQPIPWQKSWQSEVESDPSAAPAIPQPCSVLWAALLCSVSGDQSSSPAEGFEAQQALFRSSQGLLRAGGNQMTANGSRRAWPGDKVKGCNDLHPDLGAVQQLPWCAWSPGEPLWANHTHFLPTTLTAKLGVLLNTWILP